jgi:hypothetical protein
MIRQDVEIKQQGMTSDEGCVPPLPHLQLVVLADQARPLLHPLPQALAQVYRRPHAL